MYRPLLLISALTLGLATTAPAVMADSDRDERRGDRHGQSWSHDSRNDHRGDRDHDRRGEHHRREHDRHEQVRRGHDHDRHQQHRRWHDSRDHQWRGSRHAAPRYHAPHGHVHRQWRPGHRMPSSYRHSRYVVHNWQQYSLRPPPRHHHWVRVDNDVALTTVDTGVISAVVHGIFR